MQSKKVAFWIFLTSIVISFVIIAGSLILPIKRQKSSAQEFTTTTITTEPGYFVQIQENSICIFRPGCTVPLQKLDTPVNTLTEYDRNHLENGITIDSDEALRDFIEDYIS